MDTKYLPNSIQNKQLINTISCNLNIARNEIIKLSKFKLSPIQTVSAIWICILYCWFANTNVSYELDQPPVSLNDLILRLDKNLKLSPKLIKKILNISAKQGKDIIVNESINIISPLIRNDLFLELLPYTVEVLEYSSEEIANAKIDRRNGLITNKKKNDGIYYTPSDVVEYMTNSCLGELFEIHGELMDLKYVDFSCGSGIFLLDLFKKLVNSYNGLITDDIKAMIMEDCIFGVDISEYAVLNARFIMLYYIIKDLTNLSNIEEYWDILCNNIIIGDSCDLNSTYTRYSNFPRTFDCIIGNPPYVSNKQHFSNCKLDNLFIPFVYNMINYSSNCFVGSLILPLSISYSEKEDFIKLRKQISKDKASWSFIHFDRSPDALFGDDIKTRNCIVTRNSDYKESIYTSSLKRWSSENRRKLFSNIIQTKLENTCIEYNIPKIGSEIELKAYGRMLDFPSKLYDLFLTRNSPHSFDIYIKSNAYNWINAFDHVPQANHVNGETYIPSSYKKYILENTQSAYFALALLNSKTSFWYWIVLGDGFHVNTDLFKKLPAIKFHDYPGAFNELSTLGKEYSKRIIQFPETSVNSGKQMQNYNNLYLLSLVKDIDDILEDLLKLPSGFSKFLDKWYYNVVVCGRKSCKGKSILDNYLYGGKA